MLRRTLLVPFVFQASMSCAAEQSTVTENDFLSDLPVVLSASRLNQPLDEAPSAMTVIDREMIHASGYRRISDLFRLVPGFYVSNYNGHNPVVSYHGMSDQYSRRMQVLVDGRSIYMPPTGGVDWSSLPITVDDIERIEVVRGPSAAAHGANSFLGVISITTRNPALEHGTAVSLTRGTDGVADGFFRYGGRSGKLDYRIALGYRSDHGFALVNDSRRIKIANLSADYAVNPVDSLQVRLGHSGGAQGMGNPGNAGTVDPADPPRDATNTNEFEAVRWVRTLDEGDDLSVKFYHNYQNLADSYMTLPGLVPGGVTFPINAGYSGERYHLEYQQSSSISSTFRNVWGGSVRLDESAGPLYLTGRLAEPSQRIFWHGEWRATPKFLVNAGGMLEHNNYTGRDFSPQIAFNYHLNRNNTLRTSFSSAVRTPVMFEQKANLVYMLGNIAVPRFYGPGNLRPEKMRSRDVGYIGEFLHSAIVLDARLYQDHFDDLIAALPTPVPRTFGNYGTADEKGAEIQLKWKAAEATQLTASFAHTIITGDYPENYNQSAPKNNLSIFAMHSLAPGLEGSFIYTRQGDVRALGPGQLVNGFSRFDFRLARMLRIAQKPAEIALVVQNLLNTPYSEFRTLNVFGRQAYLQLSFGM
jgi:iron complex outermembrane receptor protein